MLGEHSKAQRIQADWKQIASGVSELNDSEQKKANESCKALYLRETNKFSKKDVVDKIEKRNLGFQE